MYKIGSKIFVVDGSKMAVKELTVGSILTNEEGTFYSEGVVYGREGLYDSSVCFKNVKDASVYILNLIEEKTAEYKHDLIERAKKNGR